MNKTISLIQPGLFLSGYEPAYSEAKVKDHKITHIVKVASESTFRGVTPERNFEIEGYLPIEIRDKSFERMYPYFHQIARFINDAHARGGVVLVHCEMGISRSTTAVLAHLMINKGYKLAEAHKIVWDARKGINPKLNFVIELRMLERDLFFGQNFAIDYKISDDDQGQRYALDWKYSLRELHHGWRNQEDLTMEPNDSHYDLSTGVYRLLHAELRMAARTDIAAEKTEGHLREVICEWFRKQYNHRGERAMLFRILWRALLEDDIVSPAQLSTMLDTIFTSTEYRTFIATVPKARRYAQELTRMVNTWDAITLPATQIQDFRYFVAFKTQTLQVQFSNWNWTDELHLADASFVEIMLYHCHRYAKDKAMELQKVETGMDGAIWEYFSARKVEQSSRKMDEAVAVVAELGVD